MKAVRLLEYGGQLAFNDVSTPTIARDEILVRIFPNNSRSLTAHDTEIGKVIENDQ